MEFRSVKVFDRGNNSLAVSLSVCLSVCMRLSVCLSLSLFLSLSLSIYAYTSELTIENLRGRCKLSDEVQGWSPGETLKLMSPRRQEMTFQDS